MSSLEAQCSGRRLPRQVLSASTLKANIGAQVGTVRATIWPLSTVSGCSRGLWRTSLYWGGLVSSTGRRMPILAWDGLPRNSSKKPTSLEVVGVSTDEGFAKEIDQATTLPSNGAS